MTCEGAVSLKPSGVVCRPLPKACLVGGTLVSKIWGAISFQPNCVVCWSGIDWWNGVGCKTRQASVTPTVDVGVKFISRENICTKRSKWEKNEEVIIMLFLYSLKRSVSYPLCAIKCLWCVWSLMSYQLSAVSFELSGVVCSSSIDWWNSVVCKTRQASVTPTVDVGVKFISRVILLDCAM